MKSHQAFLNLWDKIWDGRSSNVPIHEILIRTLLCSTAERLTVVWCDQWVPRCPRWTLKVSTLHGSHFTMSTLPQSTKNLCSLIPIPRSCMKIRSFCIFPGPRQQFVYIYMYLECCMRHINQPWFCSWKCPALGQDKQQYRVIKVKSLLHSCYDNSIRCIILHVP